MKKYIFLASILAIIFITPTGLNAAYNDVTLTTDAIISVNSLSLTVSGSSATIESIVVNSTNFDVTLQDNSSFKVVSADKATFSTSATAFAEFSRSCAGSESSLTLTGQNEVTVTVTPSSTACDAGTSAQSGSAQSPAPSSSGGGSITTTASQTQTTVVTEEETTTTTTSSASSITQGQIDSIIGLLKAFGAEQSIIANVLASLSGGGSSATATVKQTSGTTAVSAVFTKSLSRGMSNSDVKRLQQLLNSDPDTRVATTGVGSAGNETNYFGLLTEKAVQKFQMKYGIVSSSSDPGYGYVGSKTRTKLSEVFRQ